MKMSKSLFLAPAFGLLIAAVPALAYPVTYSTCGIFTVGGSGSPCGLPGAPAGGNTYNSGGVTITYTGATGVTGDTPFDGNLGTFTVTEIPGASQTLNNLPFTLYLYQTVPTTGGHATVDTIKGNISKSGSGTPSGSYTATVTSGQTFSLGTVDYELDDFPTFKIPSAGPGGAPGSKNLTASITAATPEPAFYSLVGVGLTGLALLRKKKKLSV